MGLLINPYAFAAAPPAAATVIATATGGGASGAAHTLTLSATPAAGDLVLVVTCSTSGSALQPSGLGATWTQDSTVLNGSRRLNIWSGVVVTPGTSISIPTGSGNSSDCAVVFRGASRPKNASANSTGPTAPMTTTVTTAVVLGYGPNASTQPAGYTMLQGTSNDKIRLAYKTSEPAGTVAPNTGFGPTGSGGVVAAAYPTP